MVLHLLQGLDCFVHNEKIEHKVSSKGKLQPIPFNVSPEVND